MRSPATRSCTRDSSLAKSRLRRFLRASATLPAGKGVTLPACLACKRDVREPDILPALHFLIGGELLRRNDLFSTEGGRIGERLHVHGRMDFRAAAKKRFHQHTAIPA